MCVVVVFYRLTLSTYKKRKFNQIWQIFVLNYFVKFYLQVPIMEGLSSWNNFFPETFMYCYNIRWTRNIKKNVYLLFQIFYLMNISFVLFYIQTTCLIDRTKINICYYYAIQVLCTVFLLTYINKDKLRQSSYSILLVADVSDLLANINLYTAHNI